MKNPVVALLASLLVFAMPVCWAAEDEGWIDRIAVGLLVPPWPASGSKQERDELAEVHRSQAQATAAEKALAKVDDTTYGPDIFASVLGPGFDLSRLPKTKQVLDRARDVDRVDSKTAKQFFKRPRPWIVDPTVQTCNSHEGADPLSAYPSGHTMEAYILGVVLANLMPEKAQAILARAAQYSEHRILCGFHYRSDVAAGQQFGSILAVQMLHHPRFQGWVAEARAELITAGLVNK